MKINKKYVFDDLKKEDIAIIIKNIKKELTTKNISDLTDKELKQIRKHFEYVLNTNEQEKVYVLVTIETRSDPEGKEIQEIKGVFKDKTLAVHEKKSLKKHKYYDLIYIEEHFIK
jgi:tRNA C32,U32 (ribose-2'-O)-methylase TrmJ